MQYEELKILFGASSSLKLLRAKNAPLIVSFLFREFKTTENVTISNNELVTRLADTLETHNYIEDIRIGDAINYAEILMLDDYILRAKRYIDEWCNEENRYLRKFPGETGESVHELTADTEKVFQWVESLKKKAFIGTESRFLDIFSKLKELIDNSYEDPDKKIAELELKKQEIEQQIRDIKATGKVETFTNTQIKERFYEINKLGRELNSDFKEVEQNFKDITRNIYEKQMLKDITKGEILGFALDSAEELKISDQGRSFYAFWFFLISPDRQDELSDLIENVYLILEDKNIKISESYLRHIKLYLHSSGQKVVDSNHKLANKLSLVLTEQNLMDRQKTVVLIKEIKRMVMEKKDSAKNEKEFITIEVDADINLTMDRPLGGPKQNATFMNQPVLAGNEFVTEPDLYSLINRFEVNKDNLKKNIAILLENNNQVSLTKVIENYPLTKGLAEIVAYLSIASEYPEHTITDLEQIRISWIDDDMEKIYNLPQVIFVK